MGKAEFEAGDAQRVWFPEMIERLRTQWNKGMSLKEHSPSVSGPFGGADGALGAFDSLIALRDDPDAMLQRIGSDRHIRPCSFQAPGVRICWRGRDASSQCSRDDLAAHPIWDRPARADPPS